MSVDAYERMAVGQADSPSARDWLDKAAEARAYLARSRADINAELARERDAWDGHDG